MSLPSKRQGAGSLMEEVRLSLVQRIVHDLKGPVMGVRVLAEYLGTDRIEQERIRDIAGQLSQQALHVAKGFDMLRMVVFEERPISCDFASDLLEPAVLLFAPRIPRLICHPTARDAPKVFAQPALVIAAILWLIRKTQAEQCICAAEVSQEATTFVLTLRGEHLLDPASLEGFGDLWEEAGIPVQVRKPENQGTGVIALRFATGRQS